MVKRMSLSLLVMSLAVVLLSVLFPQKIAAQGEYQEDIPPAAHHDKIQGTVARVDIAGNNLTVRTENNYHQTLSMDSRTAIKVKGMPGTVTDLKEGQEVTIVAEGLKAVSVEVIEQTAAARQNEPKHANHYQFKAERFSVEPRHEEGVDDKHNQFSVYFGYAPTYFGNTGPYSHYGPINYGYYDRWGHWHPYGYYDMGGYWHPY